MEDAREEAMSIVVPSEKPIPPDTVRLNGYFLGTVATSRHCMEVSLPLTQDVPCKLLQPLLAAFLQSAVAAESNADAGETTCQPNVSSEVWRGLLQNLSDGSGPLVSDASESCEPLRFNAREEALLAELDRKETLLEALKVECASLQQAGVELGGCRKPSLDSKQAEPLAQHLTHLMGGAETQHGGGALAQDDIIASREERMWQAVEGLVCNVGSFGEEGRLLEKFGHRHLVPEPGLRTCSKARAGGGGSNERKLSMKVGSENRSSGTEEEMRMKGRGHYASATWPSVEVSGAITATMRVT